MIKTYHIKPVAKPRMTRSDKWKKRKCVVQYWAFKDQVKLMNIQIPEGGCHITFVVPMPPSWSEKKRVRLIGKPHHLIPDIDNFLKGLLDAVFISDSHIWDVRATKIWGVKGMITVEDI